MKALKQASCPYCSGIVAADLERGIVYHQKPTCERWAAEMRAGGGKLAGPVLATMLSVEPSKEDPS